MVGEIFMETQILGTHQWRLSGWILFPTYILLLAALLTICDYISHVRLNVLWYTNPMHLQWFPNQPTGDVFMGFLRIAAVCTALGWLGFRSFPAPAVNRALLSAVVFVACYYASGVFNDYPMSLYAGFMVLWVIQLISLKQQLAKLIIFSVLLGVSGPVLEGWSSSNGFFAYYDQDAYHVPLWLSALYFNGALAVVATLATMESWRV
jgi:hypothetical protein